MSSTDCYDTSEGSATGTNHSVAEPVLLRQFAECPTSVRSLIDAGRSSAISDAVRLDCAAICFSPYLCRACTVISILEVGIHILKLRLIWVFYRSEINGRGNPVLWRTTFSM
jgi:hypothetical protein